jgi:hypothetical protein
MKNNADRVGAALSDTLLGFYERPLCGLSGLSPASHRGGPGSHPGQFIWDLWWTNWHWDRFVSPNVVVEWFQLLLHIREVPGSNLGTETVYPV